LADSAYGSGDTLAALDDAGHRILIKPWSTHRNAKLGDDQFHRDDFTIDYVARTVTCPNGITTHITPGGTACFGKRCDGCPVRSRCTSAVAGKTFVVGEHDHLLAANRARWNTDTDLVADYRQHRPMVERTGLPRVEVTSELACSGRPERMTPCPSRIRRSSATTS